MSCLVKRNLTSRENLDIGDAAAKLSLQTMSLSKSRKENPQKLTQLSSRSHPRHLSLYREVKQFLTHL